MQIYQHDSAAMFRFVLQGELCAADVPDLEWAWTTARSVATRKEFVIDVSGITAADTPGVELLRRMQDAGARLTASGRRKSEALVRELGLPETEPEERRGNRFKLLLLNLIAVGGPPE